VILLSSIIYVYYHHVQIDGEQIAHADHLGSTAAISDEAGAVIERLAYDPWGRRRFANGGVDAGDLQSFNRYSYVHQRIKQQVSLGPCGAALYSPERRFSHCGRF
jgi:hypothetical protein